MKSYGLVKNTAIGIKDAIDDFADSYIRTLEELWDYQFKVRDAINYIKENKNIDEETYFELLEILGDKE